MQRDKYAPTTHAFDDFGSVLVYLSRQPEARKRDRKIDTFFAIVDARIHLLDGERRQGLRDPLGYRDPERIEDRAGGIGARDRGERWERHVSPDDDIS